MSDKSRLCNPRQNNVRITRASAKALGGLPPLNPLAKLGNKPKRTADDDGELTVELGPRPQLKNRIVLKDVSNVAFEKLQIECNNATRVQRKGKPTPACIAKRCKVNGEERQTITEELTLEKEESEVNSAVVNLATKQDDSINAETLDPVESNSCRYIMQLHSLSKGRKFLLEPECLNEHGIMDIDSHKDSLMCSLYAADIYSNFHTAQVGWRPKSDYMERLQQDITLSMRGILIDWLVEVCEEYKLVPDTLYLTVNLIDRFLSENQVEKQKLQLLGVTCMLIASKYEEICAPCVEDFCYITDGTYTREEVLKMESRVVNSLGFRLSVPTTKKFLRRFIHAAQVSHEVPSVEFEFLANYLAELTLTDYSLLEFLPSLLAASAVFLASWTIDQSDHPWNQTMEYYTRYKPSDLQTTVLKLQDLQLNTSGCTLGSIRRKYGQPKFKIVSTLRSLTSIESIFEA